MNKNNPSRDPYTHKPKGLTNVVFDLQDDEKLTDLLPSKQALAIGIPSVLFIAWLSIWMAAILLNGCVESYDFPDYSQIEMNDYEVTLRELKNEKLH